MDLAVIALSARPLIASAARAGLSALSFDLFAELDTCAKAARCVRVHRKNGYAFDGDDLIQALTHLAPGGLPVVLGAGLEDDPALMERIAERNPILGNAAETVRVVKDPIALSALCATLKIPFPQIAMDAPDAAFAVGPTLDKRIGGCGGGHIARRAAGDQSAPAPGRYLQREVSGQPYSLLLLANGIDARVVGVSRQWHAPASGHPFRYGGSVGPVDLPGAHDAAIRAAAIRMALACGLVGLVSVDFIVEQDRWWLVEVNPRLSSSLDLFDIDPMPPLLALHLAACGGRLPGALPIPPGRRAFAVLHAPEDLVVPERAWPVYAVDRPAPGTAIRGGAPICSVRASGATLQATQDQLQQRLAGVRSVLGLEAAELTA